MVITGLAQAGRGSLVMWQNKNIFTYFEVKHEYMNLLLLVKQEWCISTYFYGKTVISTYCGKLGVHAYPYIHVQDCLSAVNI